jgi:hypothetical protein
MTSARVVVHPNCSPTTQQLVASGVVVERIARQG